MRSAEAPYLAVGDDHAGLNGIPDADFADDTIGRCLEIELRVGDFRRDDVYAGSFEIRNHRFSELVVVQWPVTTREKCAQFTGIRYTRAQEVASSNAA